MRIKKIALLVLLNVGAVTILFCLQFLMFAFLPAISPHVPAASQRDHAITLILNKSVMIIPTSLTHQFR
jgi:hypothetical protein